MSELLLEDCPVIGEVGPRPDGLDAPYWEGLREGRLLLQRCGACATWIWAPQWSCPACRTLAPSWAATEARGVVYSWTRTWQPFVPQFRETLPYLTVLVELPQAGGRRLLGLLLGDQERDPVLGEELVGVVQPPSEITGGAAVLRWRR